MKILFICSGNTCRSPMAEAIFRGFYNQDQDKPQIASAGIFALPGEKASANAIFAMSKRGLCLSGHHSRPASAYLVDEADIIITMDQSHKKALLLSRPDIANKILSMAEIGGQDISDPFGGDQSVYERCAAEIEKALRILWQKLKSQNQQESRQEKGKAD
jgi:protein-tyrosine-phosphatase